MGNVNRVSYRKTVFLMADLINDDGKLIFKSGTPYNLENNLIQNSEKMRISLDDIWVDFRVEVTPLTEG